MMIDAEAGAARRSRGRHRDGSLQGFRRGHVFDQPAARADQMVVMAGELFGQLVAGVVIVGDDAPHDPGTLEHYEVAVGGALCQPDPLPEDLGNGERSVGSREDLDEHGTVGCQSGPARAELPGDHLLQGGSTACLHRCGVYRRPGRAWSARRVSHLGGSAQSRYAWPMTSYDMDEQEARRRLGEERDRVSGLIDGLRAELGDTPENEEVGELAAYDQHPADLASETFEREKDLSILEGLESTLAEIEAALHRIDEGTWGTDEETGESIDPARLEANPAARTNIGRDQRRP